jgi:transcriptional regulator with XRE-family HTH domain
MPKSYSHEQKRERDKQSIRTNFGVAVRTRRARLGFSQEELAHRAGLHRTYITDVENGLRNISLDNISKLAFALEITISQLFALAQRRMM